MDPKLEALVVAATDGLKSEPPTNNLWRFLNSGFVLTVLGGVLISGVGAWLQNRFAESKARAERNEAIRTTKLECLKEFSECLNYQLSFQHSIRKREIWIARVAKIDAGDRANLKFSDGRNYAETRDYWEQLRGKTFEKKEPLGVMFFAMAIFSGGQVRIETAKLVKSWNNFCECESPDDLDKYYEEVLKGIETILSKMGDELNYEDKH